MLGETIKVIGYVSLTVGEVRREFLPKARQRNMPNLQPIFLAGQLAIYQRWQGPIIRVGASGSHFWPSPIQRGHFRGGFIRNLHF